MGGARARDDASAAARRGPAFFPWSDCYRPGSCKARALCWRGGCPRTSISFISPKVARSLRGTSLSAKALSVHVGLEGCLLHSPRPCQSRKEVQWHGAFLYSSVLDPMQ